MRSFAIILLLAGCSQEPAPEAAEQALYVGEGRDSLCIKGERAGFITYGEGDMNCSAKGRLERAGVTPSAILPDGDQDCRIALSSAGESITLGAAGESCSYYCGPGASFAGKRFTKASPDSPAVDFAGDPLC